MMFGFVSSDSSHQLTYTKTKVYRLNWKLPSSPQQETLGTRNLFPLQDLKWYSIICEYAKNVEIFAISFKTYEEEGIAAWWKVSICIPLSDLAGSKPYFLCLRACSLHQPISQLYPPLNLGYWTIQSTVEK